jgi:AAA domain
MPARDRVEAALTAAGCRSYGRDSWTCPAHEDRSPSLMVQSGRDGRVIVKCHAGCDYRDILTALGLTMDDLFELPLREVARYPYRTDGMVYEKIRFAADGRKTFRWEPALNGHRMPLYRVDEMLDLPGPVYLIESEKDVDTLLGMGVAATCMPGGAGDWREEYSRVLSGREVVIVADRDGPGVEHAMKVLVTLGRACIVQSKTLGEHHDVGDHLAAGYSLAELVPFRPENEISKRYSPINWHDAFKAQTDEVDWLFPPLIEAGTLNVLFGLPGVGKSLLTLDIALQVIAEGKTVMMIDEENRPADLVERLKKFGRKPDELDKLIVYNFASLPPLDTPPGGEHLAALADVNKPSLIVLDTTTRMVEGDENAASTWLQTYRCSLVPLKSRGIAVLRLDHQGKDASRGQRGSSAKDGDVDTIWRLKFQDKDDGRLLALEREKTRSGHGEEWILIRRMEDPLRHEFQELDHFPITPAIRQWARNFDDWGIPRDAGRPTLRAAIKEHQTAEELVPGVDTTILALVARYRKAQAQVP